MQMHTVKSSLIEAVGYDPHTRTLRVKLNDTDRGTHGPTYEYSNVSPQDHAALITAKSIGRHFNKEITAHPDRFPHKQLPETEVSNG